MELKLDELRMTDLINIKVKLHKQGKITTKEAHAITKYLAFIINDEVEAS